MAKIVLNTVRLLSMEELYSVALAKRVIVLEPELAKLIGVQSGVTQIKGTAQSHMKTQKGDDFSYRDSLIGRVICCALLQKGVRSKPLPDSNYVYQLIEALNASELDVSFSLDRIKLEADKGPSKEDIAEVTSASDDKEIDHLVTEVITKLGITAEWMCQLTKGRTSMFAAVSVISAMVNAFAKFSDCVMGLICEALKINTGFLACPELQRIPNCIGVVRNLIWLTEDSKVIPSSAGSPKHESLLTSYIVANGETQQLSKAVMKISSDMIPEVCGNSTKPLARGLAEKAWHLSLQSHVSSLCRSLAAIARFYAALLSDLLQSFQELTGQKAETPLSEDASLHDFTNHASAYQSLLEEIAARAKDIEEHRGDLYNLDRIAVVCSDAALACVLVSRSIFSANEQRKVKATEKKGAKTVGVKGPNLGHGNIGFYAYLSETIMANAPASMDYSKLKSSFGGCHVLLHLNKVDDLLVPRNQQLRKVKVPKGTVDFLPDEMMVRSMVMNAIRGIFRQHGACEIDTPVFELRETLMGKYGEDQKLIFDLKDSGGEQLSLRYDLTVPFARFLGSNKIEKMKRFHIGKVYRRDEPQINRGRFREFVQCDLDFAGVYPPMVADAEIIFILIRILRMLMPDSFQLKISHRVVLDAILKHCGVADEMHRTICSSIDKLDKEPWTNVRDEMINEKGLPEAVVEQIKHYVEINGAIQEVVEALRGKNIPNTSEALEDMTLLGGYLRSLGAKDKEVIFDLSLARGLDYYTGIIFEAVLTKGSVGSVGAGGRYDGLIGMLSGKSTPAVGMSVGIERIMKVLAPSDVISDITDVFVCTMGGEDDLQERLQLCSLLWSEGINAAYHYSPKANLRKQLDAATGKQAQMVVIAGKSEQESNNVRIKILDYDEERKGEEIVVRRHDMVASVRRMLNERGNRYQQLERRLITGMV